MNALFKKSSNQVALDKYKYNKFEAEIKAVKKYLFKNIATATMTAIALNIYRPNLCRHKSVLQKQGYLIELPKGKCKETGYYANYLSCNPKIIKEVLSGK